MASVICRELKWCQAVIGNRGERSAKLDQPLNSWKVSLRDGMVESRVLILVEGIELRACGHKQLNRWDVAANRRHFEGPIAEMSRRVDPRARPAAEFREVRHLVQNFIDVLPLARVHSV